MTDVIALLAETRSRVSEIAMHVARLPAADDVPDETYAKVLDFLQRSIQKSFQVLDDDKRISQPEMMLLHDIRGAVVPIFACSEIMNEQCADHLSVEQKEPVRTIEKLSYELVEHLRVLADQDSQFN